MKYTDDANPMKGDEAYARLPLKELAPKAHNDTVALRVPIDGRDADDLFTIMVSYTLTRSGGNGMDRGTFTAFSKNTGGLWKTEISNSPEPFVIMALLYSESKANYIWRLPAMPKPDLDSVSCPVHNADANDGCSFSILPLAWPSPTCQQRPIKRVQRFKIKTISILEI